MMLLRKKKAASIVEYMCLIIITIGAMVVIQPHVIRALGGNWKKSGDSFGLGRRYNSNTIDCDYLQRTANTGIWYDATCYQQSVQACAPGNTICEDGVMTSCATDFCTNH